MQKTEKVSGCSIDLYRMNSDNRDKYLEVYRTASNFSDLYEMSEELWKAMSEPMGTEDDKTVRYLVCMKKTKTICGVINYDMEAGVPSIDIAIAHEYRHRGLGYDAAKTLCDFLLSKEKIDCIYWYAMPNNEPSVKIAEKLHGERIDGRNILAEVMSNTLGKTMDQYEDLPSTAFYVIKSQNSEEESCVH